MQVPKLQLFNPNLTKLLKLKKKVFFFQFITIKRVAGMVDLQKLGKALAHSGDITMNICFWWEGGNCIQVMVFLCENVQLALLISPCITTDVCKHI